MKKIVAAILLVLAFSANAADGWVMDLKKSGKVTLYTQPCDIPEAINDGLTGRGFMSRPNGHPVEICWAYTDNRELVDEPSFVVWAGGNWLAFSTHLFKQFNGKSM